MFRFAQLPEVRTSSVRFNCSYLNFDQFRGQRYVSIDSINILFICFYFRIKCVQYEYYYHDMFDYGRRLKLGLHAYSNKNKNILWKLNNLAW